MKKYPNDLIGDIMKAFGKYADRPAFVIEDTACTYGELATCVQKISSLFKDREDKIIGIVAENRLETYASILSALICGKTYVILHPSYPNIGTTELPTRQASASCCIPRISMS